MATIVYTALATIKHYSIIHLAELRGLLIPGLAAVIHFAATPGNRAEASTLETRNLFALTHGSTHRASS